MPEQKPKTIGLPSPGQLRAWVKDSLDRLKISPYAISRDAGVSRNHVAVFLSHDKRDMTIGVASALVSAIYRRAEADGARLPAFPRGERLEADPTRAVDE